MKAVRKIHISIVYTGKEGDFGKDLRTRNLQDVLLNSGFKVSNIACPYVDRSNIFSIERIKNILFYILPLRTSHNMPFRFSVESATQAFRFSVSLNCIIRALEKLKPDVLLAETSPVGWVAVEAAKKYSVPCLIDAHGLAFAESKGSGNEDWREIILLEKLSFERCDHLFVVSENMRKYLSDRLKIPIEKITVASNGSCIQECFAKYKDPLNVIYAGIFAYWEKIGDFLELAKKADVDKFRFFLAGDGPLRDQILKRIEDEKIPVKYLGYIPRPKMPRLLESMHIGIAPSTNDLTRQVASPIKVFDYLASGLPVITPKIGDWGDIIQQENCGIALNNDILENYINALETIYSKPNWEEKSMNAINAIKYRYNWSKTLEPITEYFTKNY